MATSNLQTLQELLKKFPLSCLPALGALLKHPQTFDLLSKEVDWWSTHHAWSDPCPRGKGLCSCAYSTDTQYAHEAKLVTLVKTLFDSKDEEKEEGSHRFPYLDLDLQEK